MNIVKMRSLIMYTMILIVCLANLTFAKAYDISEISKVKLVTEYSEDTNVDEMDTVTFGSYPQSDTNGITKEPIEWIVLDRQVDKALLFSKYILDAVKYCDSYKELDNWSNSNFRYWLNSYFLSTAFDEIEVANIVENNGDRIFILNNNDLDKYFDVYNNIVFIGGYVEEETEIEKKRLKDFFVNGKAGGYYNFVKNINKLKTNRTNYLDNLSALLYEKWINNKIEYGEIIYESDCNFIFLDVKKPNWISYESYGCNEAIFDTCKMPIRPALWVSVSAFNNTTNDINIQNNTNNIISELKNNTTNKLLSVVEKNGKWGVIDAQGNIIANFQYDEIKDYSEGLAACKKNNKWGFIDSSGREIIKCEYDIIDISSYESFFELLNIKPYSFSEGVITLIKDNTVFLFDKSGKVVKSIDDFNINFNFSNGLALVHKNHKYGYIDKNFNDVIEPQFDYASSFVNGLAAVKSNDKWGFIDVAGNNVVKCEYDFVIPFYSDKTSVCKNNKWGLIDRNGKTIIDCKYDLICKYADGRARIKSNGKWGFIDENGKVVIDCKYNGASDFSDGVALVKEGTLNNYIYLDKNGKRAVDISLEDIGSEFKGGTLSSFINGIINIFNKNIVMLENATSFNEGLAFVSITEKKGYINKDGILVIDLTNRVDAIHNFNNAVEDTIDSIDEIEDIKSKLEGEFPFSYSTKDFYEDSAKLMINTMGKMNDIMGSSILNTIEIIKYGDAGEGYKFNNGYAAVKHNGQWGFINNLGNLVIDYQYDLVRNFELISSYNLVYDVNINNSSNDYALYNTILNNIESTIVVYEPGFSGGKGKANYTGYQLFDVDNDGTDELFIFRDYVYDNLSGGKGIYIDKAYTIKNNQVQLLLSTDYTEENAENGDWQNGAYYALKDGRILYDGYRTFSLIDKKNNTTEHYLYEIGGADGVWVNDDDVIVKNANDKLEYAKSLKPYFDVPLQTQLISEEDNKVTYEYNGETYSITIPNVTAGPH